MSTVPTRIAVVSDTHLPRADRVLPRRLLDECEAADLVLHAGDVASLEVLLELRAYAPVLAVRGNVDPPELFRELPPLRLVERGGVRILVVHDAGPAAGRGSRLRTRFPDADVVVFGHSHIPLVERHGDLLLLNPGSAIDRRRQPSCTMARLVVADGRAEATLIRLPEERRTGARPRP